MRAVVASLGRARWFLLAHVLVALSLLLWQRLAQPGGSLPWLVFYQRLFACSAEEFPPLLRATRDLAKLGTMHLGYCGTGDHLRGIMLSMISVARNQRQPADTIIHVIASQEDFWIAEAIEKAYQLETADLQEAKPPVRLHGMKPLPFDVSTFLFRPNPRLAQTPESWVRMYMHEYLPAAPRVIWLDSDVVANADLRPLYEKEMTFPIAMARENLLYNRGGFNSGVLLIDLHRYRRDNIVRTLERVTEQFSKGHVSHGPEGFCDQNIWNEVFKSWVDVLPWQWNVLGLGVDRFSLDKMGLIKVANAILYHRCWERAKLLHFNWVRAGRLWHWHMRSTFLPYLGKYSKSPAVRAVLQRANRSRPG